jgi:hypothetical protein
MTAEELYGQFLNLNEVERIKFERMIVGNKKNQEERLKEIRGQIFNKMSDIKKEDGTPYFDSEHLKKNLGL